MQKTFSIDKRIISFIMALLMILSSFIYISMPESNAAAYSVSSGSDNWDTWFDTYVGATGAYYNGLGDYNNNNNPFSVNSSNHLVADIKDHANAIGTTSSFMDCATVASSKNGVIPSKYTVTYNINTSKGGTYYAVDGNGNGTFSIGILEGQPSLTCMSNWAHAVINGFNDSKNGVVLNFKSTAASKLTYDYIYIYLNGVNVHVGKLSDLGLTVNCNGTSDLTVSLEELSSGKYDVVLSTSDGKECSLYNSPFKFSYSVSDSKLLYYSVGSFPCGQQLNDTTYNLQTDGSFTIKSVGSLCKVVAAADFNGNNHSVSGSEQTNYYLETCSVCSETIAKRYNITFDTNGGTGGPDDSSKAYTCSGPEVKATYTIPSAQPTRSGYNFAGWKASTNDTAINGNIYQPGASFTTGYHITLVAQWTEGTYTLTLDTNGGTMPSGFSTTYSLKTNEKLADKIGGFPVPTRTGYTFNGWKLISSGEHWVDGWGTQPYTWGQNVTITAQWTANTYTVTFDKNASDAALSTTSKTVTFGSTYGTLPTPTRTGYTFLGWYTAASGGSKVTSSTTVNTASAHTLYAHWQGASYTVTLDTNGGTMTSGHSTTYTVHYGDSYTDIFGSYPTAVLAGYKLDGWEAVVNGSVVYTLTSDSMADQYTVESNATFRAKWTSSPYNLTIDPMGGTINGSESAITKTINYGALLNTVFDWNDILPTKEGYVFQGWKLGNALWSDKATWDATPYNVPDDATMNAIWEPDSYTVTFDAKGGTVKGSSTYSSDIVYAASLDTAFPWDNYVPVRSGYEFTGWKISVPEMNNGAGYTKTWNTTNKWEGNTWLIPYDATLEAQWTAKTAYTVTFDANGGSCSVTSITVYVDEAYGTLPTPTRTGYSFDGWYTGSSGGSKVTSSTVCTTAGDHTLYAHWLGQEYTLTFALNGDHATHEGFDLSYTVRQDQLLSEVISPFPVPVMNGYSFAGWRHSTSAGEFWTNGWGTQPFTWGQNVTLNAEWNPVYGIYKTTAALNMRETASSSGTLVTTLPSDTMVSVTQMSGKWAYCTVYYTDGVLYQGWMSLTYLEYVCPDSFTFKLDPSGGNFNGSEAPKEESISYNNSFSSVYAWNDIQPVRAGYVFAGWHYAGLTWSTETLWNAASYVFFSDVAMIALWSKDTFTVTLDANGGTINGSETYSKDILFESALETEFPWDSHIPVRSGWEFSGWTVSVPEMNNGTGYTKTWNTTDKWEGNTWLIPYDATIEAQWTAKTPITVTFNANGGSCSTASKVVYNDEAYGTLPEPTRTNYNFDGWYTEAEGGTKVTSTTVVTATSNHSLYAHWLNAKTYTITFVANGNLNVEDYCVDKTVAISGATLPDGSTTGTFKISKDQSFAEAVGNDAYFPTHSTWTFTGWGAAYYDEDGNVKSLILNSSNWNTAVFDGASDVTFTAYYVCQHSRFTNAISVWDSTTNPDRVIGRCRVCGYDGAYGYIVNFLARYNYEADILLSVGVPQDELFTYENCLYDATNGFIIDFLDITDTHPKITVCFNPIILAAQDSDAGWLGWQVDGDSTVNVSKNVEYIFDQSNNARNKHLRFISAYEDGYNEIVFNAGVGLKNGYNETGVLVDTNRRYGVLAIRDQDIMHELVDYIPQAKHIGYYPNAIFNPILDENNAFQSFSNTAYTLFCSIGWAKAEYFVGNTDTEITASMMNAWYSSPKNVLNSQTCENPFSITNDVQMLPWYFSQPKYGNSGAIQDDGIAQGYLATIYANNKGASETYNNAYFDLNERSGGTMYYMYTKSGTAYTCTPIFGFDSNDYNGAGELTAFIFEPTTHDQCRADFNITVYDSFFSSYNVVIAKEPKRYTYYIGEGDHYVFPKVVSDPSGAAYTTDEALDSDFQGDPDFDYIEDDGNGNSYYNTLSSNNNMFKLSRSSYGSTVANLYTIYATWARFGYTSADDYLPLGFPGVSYFGGNQALYTPVQEHGAGFTYFVTAADYQDYGPLYGASIPLTYPDGNSFVSMYPEMAAAGLPMQACYYMQWDFEVTFNSNYPTGQTHDETVGYPTSLPDNSDGSSRKTNVDKNDGDHYVYDFFQSFGNTPGKNNKMFTCDDYVIVGWQLFNQNGDAVWYDHDNNASTPGVHLILKTSDKIPDAADWKLLTETQKNEYEVSIYNAYVYAREPGCEFRAIWQRVCNFTLIEDEADWGAENFARVKYKDRFGDTLNPYLTETTTLKVLADTQISITGISAAANYTYTYLTLNVEAKPTVPRRIVTNADNYKFTIISDTTMSAKFISSTSTAGALIDRNNQLLTAWAQRMYKGEEDHRNSNVDESSLKPSYAMYDTGSESYTVTVSGSTFGEANISYTKKYDELVTLMTGASGFKGWQVNGVFVSFDPIFDYRVTGDAIVTTVYSGTEAPAVSIVKSVTSDSRETAISTHAAPEGYTLIEAGFLISGTEVTLTVNDIVDNTYTKIVSANRLTDGAFKLFLPSGTNYVAAYAYYYDKNGNIIKCISNTIQL